MSAAEPPQGANSAPAGGSAAAKPQAWGDHTSAAEPPRGGPCEQGEAEARSARRACIAATVRADVRALSRYPVAFADGWVKLDAMENPYALPGRAAASDRRRRSRACRSTAIPTATRAPVKAALRAALRAARRRRPDARQRLRRADPDPHVGGRGAGRGRRSRPSRRSSCTGATRSLRTRASSACRLRAISRSTSTRCWRRSSASARRSCGSPIRTTRPATCSTAPMSSASSARRPGVVAIDEAYYAFADASFLPRVLDFPNVVVVRTVSKIGMAGLRLGYAVGAPATGSHELEKMRPPYNVSSLTQAALPRAARSMPTRSRDRRRRSAPSARGSTRRWRRCPASRVFATQTNFVLARVPDARGMVRNASRREDPRQEPRRLASAARELPANHRRHAGGERRARRCARAKYA